MKDIMRKHLWPAALVAALAVVGMLAAFVVLTGPQRGTVEAQSLCATASGATLQSLIQSGVCSATGGTPAPTTGAGGGGAPSPVAPGQPGATTPATGGGTGSVCDTATGEELRALIQAGVCMATATPAPTATATPEPTNTPAPTPTRIVPTGSDGKIKSSSTSASAGVTLTLTIASLDDDLEAGSSVVLFLEDDFVVPGSIAQSNVYFRAIGDPTNTRNFDRASTNSGGRVYATDPIEISDDDHFGGDDDWDIQVFLPDFNTGDDYPNFDGPKAGQTLQLVILKSGGIKNPPEEGTHSVGYSVLDAGTENDSGPQKDDDNIDGAPLRTNAKISLSDEDNTRGYELTVTGTGFNNGTSAAVHVLADEAVTQDLDLLVNGRDVNGNGDFTDAGDIPATDATKEQACSLILTQGQRAGIATVDSDDTVAVTFEVTVPIFKPGNQNFLCMVDGEGRDSGTDVEQFKLEPSIRITPASASVGDTVTVNAQDFPTPRATLTSVKIANQVVWPESAVDQRFPENYVRSLDPASIGSDGSATITFDMPGSVSDSPLEGTIRIDARWGGSITAGTMTGGGKDTGGTTEDAKITLTGSSLRLSVGEARANDSVTIQGDGFGSGYIAKDKITLDGVPVIVDEDSLNDNDQVEVSNAGQFVATIYLWAAGASRDGGDNPALIAGTHTIRVQDSEDFFGTVAISIVEPSITVLPNVRGPRQSLKVRGSDWPVDNQDSGATVLQVSVTVEVGARERTYTVIPDGTGRFVVEHQVSRNVAIPSTQQVRASYGTQIVKTGSFEVPEATIDVNPTQGQPGDEVTLTVTGMPVRTEVDEITIGGANALGRRSFRTNGEGDVTAEDLAIPGLDPGTYSVVMKVGSGSSQTVAIGSLEVLPEGDADGVVSELPGALEALGDNLEAVFYFDNVSKEWSFYDPREEFADLNTLSGLVADQPYWILVGEAVDEVLLNENPRDLTCSNGDCWNLVVW